MTVYGENDSYILNDVLSHDFASRAFEILKADTPWTIMHNRGGPVPRLISVQFCPTKFWDAKTGDVRLFCPLYRHPADAFLPGTEYSPIIKELAEELGTILGKNLNHALVQYYRNGEDIITEHADKTLDMEEGSVVVNFSLGATRNLTLRTKEKESIKEKDGMKKAYKGKIEDGNEVRRKRQTVVMKHNSMFVLGEETNKKWVHGIRPDRTMRADGLEESCVEKDMGRISITFRTIATFVNDDASMMFGVGADHSKGSVGLDQVVDINGNLWEVQKVERSDEERDKLFMAFSRENKSINYSSKKDIYGNGYNII